MPLSTSNSVPCAPSNKRFAVAARFGEHAIHRPASARSARRLCAGCRAFRRSQRSRVQIIRQHEGCDSQHLAQLGLQRGLGEVVQADGATRPCSWRWGRYRDRWCRFWRRRLGLTMPCRPRRDTARQPDRRGRSEAERTSTPAASSSPISFIRSAGDTTTPLPR